jgi:hypothetical protein
VGSSERRLLKRPLFLSGVLLCTLRINVGSHSLKRRATNTTDEVSPVPEQRLPVKIAQMLRETLATTP